MDSGIGKAEIWVTVSKGYFAGRNRYIVRIERGYLFLEEPGKRVVDIKPRRMLRTSDVNLELDTGWWNYGRVTLSFDSASDAEKIEQEVKKLRSRHEPFRYKIRQIPPFSPTTSQSSKLPTSLDR